MIIETIKIVPFQAQHQPDGEDPDFVFACHMFKTHCYNCFNLISKINNNRIFREFSFHLHRGPSINFIFSNCRYWLRTFSLYIQILIHTSGLPEIQKNMQTTKGVKFI